uniref:Transcription factor TFIIIB component B'' Myb domain-containing protein n=1 Tax=Davidia involucrata TaxID=16924 RepID=A0A5B7AKI6_DAVIN
MTEEEGREANLGEFEELSEEMHGEIPVSEACEQSESGRCLRPRRKKVAVCVLGDSIDHSSHQNGGPTSVLCNSSVVEEENNNDDDNSDYEYRAEKTHRQKSTPRRSKKVMAENERSVQKRMKNEESPKKKFSHSTQRNNRPANKVLLQTPDDEINPQELTMIDLIRLAEAKERISNKKTAASRKSLHNKSADKSLHHHEYTDSYNQGLTADDDQEVCLDQSDNYNYHTFMEKTPSKRWTKKETESFYEALPLFGANPTLLQLIFPNRTTHQLKLKLKREFHQHRIRIDDALINHSNDYSLFKLVIQQMQQSTDQTSWDSSKDVGSVGTTDEEVTTESNEEVTNSEWKQEDEVTKDLEADDVREPELCNPTVMAHGGSCDDDGDEDLYRWSQYKSLC